MIMLDESVQMYIIRHIQHSDFHPTPHPTWEENVGWNVGCICAGLKWHSKLSFLMCFHQKFLQWGFCSLIVVLTSKIRFSSKNKVFKVQTHPSKGVKKNMLSGILLKINSSIYTLTVIICRKIFQTNVLENGTGQIFLIVVIVGLCPKLQMEIVD